MVGALRESLSEAQWRRARPFNRQSVTILRHVFIVILAR
jgi:hypothetical protein